MVEAFEISREKRSEYAIYYFLTVFVQLGMIYSMYTAISYGHVDYRLYAGAWSTILFAKFVASCALHLMIYPYIARAMSLMKYVLNHEDEFTHPKVAFLVCFVSHNINLMIEALNLF